MIFFSKTENETERITISQRTGYIQVKPRMSTEEMEVQGQPPQPGNVTERRLSDMIVGQRTSTPPRKILPKTANETETRTPHLPVGVVGAAMTSSRPPAQLVSSTPPRSVPLSQPLLINTCLQAPSSVAQIRPMVTAQPPPQPQPVQITQGSIIMSR